MGIRHNVFLDVALQPIPALRISPMVGWERFDNDNSNVYDGTVNRLKLEVFVNPTVWNRWIVDVSSFDESRHLETLIAWEKSPGQAFYLGGHTSLPSVAERSASSTEAPREWAAFAKASWRFDG